MVVYFIKIINDVSLVGFEWFKIVDVYDIDGFILYCLKKDFKLKRIVMIKNFYVIYYYDEGLEIESFYIY